MKKPLSGFSLIELLVVIAIIAILAGMLMPTLAGAQRKAKSIQCLGNLRQISLATVMYAEDNGGCLPRSTHSAGAYGQSPWGYAISGYLSRQTLAPSDPMWTNLLRSIYRCPLEQARTNEWSYGKNVYPELSPSETGGPTWTRLEQIPHPTATILYAEKMGGSMADHFMANFWSEGGQPEVDQNRHRPKSNYALCDSHVESLEFKRTYDPERNIDNWNPATAR